MAAATQPGASAHTSALSSATTPVAPSLLHAVSTSKRSRADVLAVVQSVCRPLLANLMRDFDNPKFRVVKSTSKLLVNAQQCVGQVVVAALMNMVGFTLVSAPAATTTAASNQAASVAGAAGEAGNDGNTQDAPPGGNADASTWQFFGTCREALTDANRQLSELEALCAQHWIDDEEDAGAAALARAAVARQQRRDDERQRERDQQRARLLALHAQDAEERRGEKTQRETDESREKANLVDDVEFAEQFVNVARKTLHHSGRLRNASFEAKHFQLRRMRTIRSFACSSCPPDNLEAHWHVINGSLLYAYCVHLSPDATDVVHCGYEHAYQYNTIPGTPHFGQTVWMTTKHVDEQTGKLDLLQHHDKPVDRCIYCNVPFRQLFL